MKVNKTTAFGLLRLLMGRLQAESTGLLNKAEVQSASIDWVLAVHEVIKCRDECAQVLVGHDLGWHIVTRCPLSLLWEDMHDLGPYQIKMETEQRLMVMGLDVCPKTGHTRSLKVIHDDS